MKSGEGGLFALVTAGVSLSFKHKSKDEVKGILCRDGLVAERLLSISHDALASCCRPIVSPFRLPVEPLVASQRLQLRVPCRSRQQSWDKGGWLARKRPAPPVAFEDTEGMAHVEVGRSTVGVQADGLLVSGQRLLRALEVKEDT